MGNERRRRLLGQAIKRVRYEKRVSQRTLSFMLGHDSHSYISDIENGKRPVSFDLICSIADALDTDVSYIFICMKDTEDAERRSLL